MALEVFLGGKHAFAFLLTGLGMNLLNTVAHSDGEDDTCPVLLDASWLNWK